VFGVECATYGGKSIFQKGDPMKDKVEIYSKIIEWLYKNHESFDSAVEWRQELVLFLKEVLEVK